MSLVSTLFLASLLAAPPADRWRPPELEVKAPPPLIDFAELEAIALRYLGRPYVMGGVGSPGFDCSGFVCRVYAEAGYALPRVSRDQARAGAAVDTARLLPGDLLFFADAGQPVSHVGLYLGRGELIHASSGRGEVVVAELGARWFATRLVGARRVLASSSTAAATWAEVPTRELEEHSGGHGLPPMLRRRAAPLEVSLGPRLAGSGATALGLRGGLFTEEGGLGALIAPEATFVLESIALEVSLAAPIRYAEGAFTAGTFERPADYARFLRTLALGLPGAELELRLSRVAALSLLGGAVLERLVPAALARGVPGLTVGTTPLSFFGAVRGHFVGAEAAVDDVFAPSLFGAAVRLDTVVPAALAAATDQQGRFDGGRRAVNAVELEVGPGGFEGARWRAVVAVRAAALSALGGAGFGGHLAGTVEHRFGAGLASGLAFEARAGLLGAGFLEGLFGPTYLAARAEHLEALAAAGGQRVGYGGRAVLRLPRVGVSAGFFDAAGAARVPLDRRAELAVELGGLRLGGTRLLDGRLGWAARNPFGSEAPRTEVLFAQARLRLRSWLALEAHLARGEAWEGGLGLQLAWLP